MVPNCTFKTMLLENPLIGRNNLYDFFNALTISHPDMVFVIKNCRVMKTPEGRCIKFKQFFTGKKKASFKQNVYYEHNNNNSNNNNIVIIIVKIAIQ